MNENDWELEYCNKCIQMTNHLKHSDNTLHCLKCIAKEELQGKKGNKP